MALGALSGVRGVGGTCFLVAPATLAERARCCELVRTVALAAALVAVSAKLLSLLPVAARTLRCRARHWVAMGYVTVRTILMPGFSSAQSSLLLGVATRTAGSACARGTLVRVVARQAVAVPAGRGSRGPSIAAMTIGADFSAGRLRMGLMASEA